MRTLEAAPSNLEVFMMRLGLVDRPDSFATEPYWCSTRREVRVFWAYRDRNGVLHSGDEKTESGAKAAARNYGYREA